VNANTNTQPGHKRNEQLSRDGKWRPIPKVANLLQYVSKGNYGRIKVGGKTIRERRVHFDFSDLGNVLRAARNGLR
jgi:hypothetical protein